MELLARIVHSGLSLYMILILLRWLGSWFGFDPEFGRWRWIARLTDPLINKFRQILPNMGPVDFGPFAALFVVWFVRVVSVGILVDMASRASL